VKGDGLVAAAFRHRTSRAAEPQLHTHVVVANLVHSPADGRWTALDARPLYRWARPVGHLYEAQLRWELTRRLGVASPSASHQGSPVARRRSYQLPAAAEVAQCGRRSKFRRRPTRLLSTGALESDLAATTGPEARPPAPFAADGNA